MDLSPRVVRHDGDARIIRFHGAVDSPVAGLWIELAALRTGRHVQALLSRTYWSDVLAYLTPMLRAWNLTGAVIVETTLPAEGALPERTVKDAIDGPVPPPAEAGTEAFAATTIAEPTVLWEWIRTCAVVSAYHRDDDEGKAEKPSGTTPDGTPAETDAPTPTATPTKSVRKSRGS